MLSERVSKLLNAFFNYPVRHYVEGVREIREGGGLTADEVEAIKSHVGCLDAHADTVALGLMPNGRLSVFL